MGENQKNENNLLIISVAAGVIISIIEVFVAWYSKSQAVLMDSIFDISEAIVAALFVLVLPLIYKPVSEKMPYGYAQIESLFMILKGSMLSGITIYLLIQNIQIIFQGGKPVDSGFIGIFELGVGIFSAFILWVLMHWNNNSSSEVVKAEIISWKIDIFCCAGLGLAFLGSIALDNTSISWFSNYIDQVVAIIVAAFMLPQPIKMVIDALRNIILISPKQETIQNIKEISEKILEEYPYKVTFYDIVQTGRRTWVEIYFQCDDKILNLKTLGEAQKKLQYNLELEFENIKIELTPDLD